MRDCCKKPENRERPVKLSDDLSVTICKACGAKHFEMEVDPGSLFGDGKAL